MQTTSQPATDNLYKFVAIFGFVIFVLCAVAIYGNLASKQQRVAELRGLQRAADTLKNIADDAPVDSPREVNATTKADDLRVNIAQSVETLESNGDVILNIVLVVMGIVAAAVTIRALMLWYTRVQKFVDTSLQTSVTSTSSGSSPATKA